MATGGAGGGATGGAGGGATGGATAGSTGGLAGAGGGLGGAAGVGGGAGTSSAGAGGASDAGRPDAADSAPNDVGPMMGDEDVREAPIDAASPDASTDSRPEDACMASDCGSCTNTVECSCASYNGHVYRFCTTARSFNDAQIQCAIATMRLARIDDLFENAWVRSTADTLAIGETWIGIEDPTKTLKWQWPDGTQFWMGDASGSPVGGLFNAWAPARPTGQSVRNCASMLGSASSGQWYDRSCTSLLPYVCELY